MANEQNLKPIKKGQRTPEEQRAFASAGGKACQKARRERASMRKAMEAILNMKATGSVKQMLAQIGYTDDEQTNANAVAATIYAMALKGDTKALEMLVNYAFQVSDDDRKTKESDARISAMEKNGVDISVNSGGDDGGVVIYLPAIEEENGGTEDGQQESPSEDDQPDAQS